MRSDRCGTAWLKVDRGDSDCRRFRLTLDFPGGRVSHEETGDFSYTPTVRVYVALVQQEAIGLGPPATA